MLDLRMLVIIPPLPSLFLKIMSRPHFESSKYICFLFPMRPNVEAIGYSFIPWNEASVP